MFNALNGPELLEYILSQVRAKLESTGEFLPNITFPWIKFEYEVKVLSYPKQAMTDDPKIVVTGGEGSEFPGGGDLNDIGKTIAEVSYSEVIDTPDQARVDSGQPVPTTTPGTKGVLVDKPVEMKVPTHHKGKHA